MHSVYLSDTEIASLLNGIEVSTAFYEACKKKARFSSVVDIFDDAIKAQAALRLKLTKAVQTIEQKKEDDFMAKKKYQVQSFGKTYEVTLRFGHYMAGKSLALSLDTTDGEPFATITVNLMSTKAHANYAYVDTNNCPWATEFLVKNDIAKPVPNTYCQSGLCLYPLFEFNALLVSANENV